MQKVTILLALISLVSSADWSYDDSKGNGPLKWGGNCNKADKTRQSPIDIRTANTEYKKMSEFKFSNYGNIDCEVQDNGHSVVVGLDPASNAMVEGGDLPGQFKLVQFHFHWGSDNKKGSEHLIDGKAYPLEVHFVHFNTKYPNVSVAMLEGDGLAVLGFFFKIGSESSAYKDMITALPLYTTSKNALQGLGIKDLFGSTSGTFYRYPGSLTTPACYESVIWTVFEEPIEISQEQMAKFRLVHTGSNDTSPFLVDNFRPPVKLASRKVYTSYSSASGIKASLLFLFIAFLSHISH